MNIQTWLKDTAKLFTALPIETTQTWLEAELILASGLQVERAWVLGHGDTELNQTQAAFLDGFRQRRVKGEPLAYVLGRAEFCGRMFQVDSRVLIPRPETEEMIGIGKTFIDKLGSTPVVWDVGTGSGALAVTAALTFKVPVLASDASIEALQVAQKNGERLVEDPFLRPTCLQASLLSEEINAWVASRQATGVLILANLPYLPWSDQTALDKSVTAYEPASALFADEEGTALNRQLLVQLSTCAWPWKAVLEFDPPQAEALLSFANSLFGPDRSIQILQDECARERFLVID